MRSGIGLRVESESWIVRMVERWGVGAGEGRRAEVEGREERGGGCKCMGVHKNTLVLITGLKRQRLKLSSSIVCHDANSQIFAQI